MADSDEYDPAETLEEFLRAKGSVGFIALLYERSRTYSELESEIEITSSTITRRRSDADNLDLITVDLESDEHGTKHVYALTDLGKAVGDRMATKGIISSYYQMRGRQKEIEEKTKELVEWAEENPLNYVKFDVPREERLAPRDDPDTESELEDVRAAKETGNDETDTDTEGVDEPEEDDEGEQINTDTDENESSERPRPPAESLPDDIHASDEDRVQDTLVDTENERKESSDEDEDSG